MVKALFRLVGVGLVVAGGLLVLAHSRHETIGELVSGVVGQADSAKHDVETSMSKVDLTLQPASGPKSAPITATGTGYGDTEKVEIKVNSTVLTTVMTDHQGRYHTTITIPSGAICPQAQCKVLAAGKNSLKWTTTPYDITR